MAVESPPAFLQAGSYGAEQTRRAISSLLARGGTPGSIAGGLVGAADCALSPPGSGMSVNVGAGEIWIPGTTSATQGGYYCRVSSSTNLVIAAADPTNPRVDTVVAQVQDAAYVGSTNSFQLAIVTGTPTAGASLTNLSGAGAVPASSVVIGYVLVPNGAVSIVSGDLLNTAGPALIGLGSTGHSVIAASQSTSSTAYTTLSTPDEVAGIILPTDGLIAVWYQATWQETVVQTARAAIFLGSNQVKGFEENAAQAVTQAATTGNAAGANSAKLLYSSQVGLLSNAVGTAYSGDATTGQIIGAMGDVGLESGEWGGLGRPSQSGPYGGPCWIFAAAGTYTVSVQFKASSAATITVANRRLYVRAFPF